MSRGLFRIAGLAIMATAAVFTAGIAVAQDRQEIGLYDAGGDATAYIDVSDDLTIYTWAGKPVAYLKTVGAGQFSVYGFNGAHLGWFLNGALWDHDGNAACATAERVRVGLQPLKGLKELKPLKSLETMAPMAPAFSNQFGNVPCGLLLVSGADN